MNHSSYYPNYFEINDILASQERMPCKIEATLYGLGYLDPSSGNSDLIAGNKIELPCWLAVSLYSSRHNVISIQLPPIFKAKSRDILKADASVVDLHKMGPHFYEFGQHVLPVAGNEALSVIELLSQTLRDRLRKIMDISLNSPKEEINKAVSKLDELERTLFEDGQAMLKDHLLWLNRKTHILTCSSFVKGRNKRKLSEIV